MRSAAIARSAHWILAVALGAGACAREAEPPPHVRVIEKLGRATIVRPRIRRGFYEDGIWADSAFIPYNEVGGIRWQENDHSASLVVISRLRSLARRLAVPLEHYGAARRLLRDKITEHEIHFSGTGLDLGGHDEREQA